MKEPEKKKEEIEERAERLLSLCEEVDSLLLKHEANAEDALMLAAYIFCRAEKVFLSLYRGSEEARRFIAIRFARCVENARKHKVG
jgi:hypothetical protein